MRLKTKVRECYVSTHLLKGTSDLTKHIGNGVIILLHGVPGVGKTSTAGKPELAL